MIDIKLLKVSHGTSREARKLLPYIQEADVWCPENAASTEDEAVMNEKTWQGFLSSGWNRSRFEKDLDRDLSSQNMETQARDYVKTEKSYLYRNKKTIWHLERFSSERSRELLEAEAKRERQFEESVYHLEKGNVKTFLDSHANILRSEIIDIEIRDREVARNIDRAEQEIRKTFPQFEKRDIIYLRGYIGSLHQPEKYSRLLSNGAIINLPEDSKTLADRLDYAIMEGKIGTTEMEELTLRYGVFVLIKNGRLDMAIRDVEEMSFEDLVKKIERKSGGVKL